MDPAATRNPHNMEYSPGGSSAGSAAAVAAGHVPVAIGTQTNGSVIRPASFCGVYGFKPSAGMISRTGVLRTSETLDQVGVFARYYEDVALVGPIEKIRDDMAKWRESCITTFLVSGPAQVLSKYADIIHG